MRIFNLSILFILLLFLACSENDETIEITVLISDFETTIDENPSAGISLGTIEASTNQGSLTYSIIEQSPSNAFAINSSTGELTVSNETLFDFETNSTITGTVKAENGDVSETANITINLNDVNEITVSIEDFETTINENPELGQSLGMVNAFTNQGSLTYSIVEQSPSDAFAINSSTGELTVSNETLFDFETNSTITGTVKAENGDVSETANITINLNDVNEQNLQDRLNNGETPCEIYQSDNSLLDELYGLTYQGGLIFYLNTNDCTGMVAAENDQSSEIEWGCEGVNISGAEFSEIGSGLSNTNAIVSECNEMSYAAKICFDLTLENYDDWYLPSKDELNLLYNNLHLKNLGNFENGSNNCCNGWYWSSTEFEDQDNYNSNGYEAVWVQSFREGNNGMQTTYDVGIKSSKNHVRAIRNF